MNMIHVDTREADKKLKALSKQLSAKQIISVTRMSMNRAVKKGKTEIKRSILGLYNIKSSRIDNSDRKKGLSVKLAQGNKLSAEVDAGHTPVNLSETKVKFKGVEVARGVSFKNGKAAKGKSYKRSVSSIAVQVLKAGPMKIVSTAFTIGIATSKKGNQFTTPAIFARGTRGKPAFQFGKKRLPIGSLSTVSVATASLNVRAQQHVQPVVSKMYEDEMQRNMKRIIDAVPK
jgi:hypothetical protein